MTFIPKAWECIVNASTWLWNKLKAPPGKFFTRFRAHLSLIWGKFQLDVDVQRDRIELRESEPIVEKPIIPQPLEVSSFTPPQKEDTPLELSDRAQPPDVPEKDNPPPESSDDDSNPD